MRAKLAAPEAKLEQLRAAWSSGDKLGALRIASRFGDRSAESSSAGRVVCCANATLRYGATPCGFEFHSLRQNTFPTCPSEFRKPHTIRWISSPPVPQCPIACRPIPCEIVGPIVGREMRNAVWRTLQCDCSDADHQAGALTATVRAMTRKSGCLFSATADRTQPTRPVSLSFQAVTTACGADLSSCCNSTKN